MVLWAGYRVLIRVPLGWPPSLGDNGGFPTCCLRDLLSPANDKFAGVFRESVSVEESVAVDGAEVRCMAQLRVVLHRHHGVNRDDWTVVPSSLETRACSSDGGGDLAYGGLTLIDELVSNADSIDKPPIVIDGFDDRLSLVLDVVNVKDPDE